MEEIKREYSMSDTQLMMFVSNLIQSMNRDAAEFAGYGVHAADITFLCHHAVQFLMKIFSIALILGFFFYGHLFAQKEAYNWYFGHKAGITFNNYDLKPLSVDTSSIISSAGCASISDSNGNLLFYTNGETVWNRKHQIMKYGTDLSGCSGISGATQSCFIVPKTNDKNQYYIFTIDYVHCYKNPWLDTCLTKGLCYSVVDMNSSSHGEVIVKNQLLHSPVAEKITVLKHKNEKDYWIIGHEWNSNNFFAYLLLHDFGIQNIPVISRIGRNYHVDINDKEHSYCHFKRMIGYLRGSIDNKKVVSANTEHYVIEKKYIQEKGVFETEAFFGNSSIEIFDFDNLTGKLSNCFTFNLKSDSVGFYGVEFSPDRTKLYASIIEENYYCSSRNKSYLLQFHVGRTNELILIDTIYTTNSTLSALQLAPNGKIYVAKHGKYLAVIDFPNKNGKECGFRDSAVVLTSGGCWNGLPGFIYDTSLFFIHIETNSPLCEGETLELKAVIPEIFTNPSFTWTGPNGFTSTEPNPVITNVTTDMSGVYKLTVNGMSDTDSAEVIIHPNPEVGISGKTKFCEGDSTILTAAPTGTEYNYLWSTGETNPEITVKESGTYTVVVENSYGCKDSAKVSVEAIPNPEADIIAAGSTEFCKGDSVVLRAKPEGSEYSYLWSTGETSPGITVKEKGIYSVIVSVSEGCKDSASIEVTVYPLPEVNIIPDGPASFCEGDSLNLDLLDYDDYTDILWSTGEKTKRIIVTQPGEYWVEATDTNGCTGSASVDITVFPLPEVNILAIGKLRFCKGDSVILYTENEYVSYEWSTGETIREIIVKQTGIYSVNVIDSNGCTGSDAVTVELIEININLSELDDMDIGNVCVGNENEKSIILTNQREDDVYINSIHIKGNSGIFSVATSRSIPITLKEGENISITVKFTPDDMYDYLDSLIVEITEPCYLRHAAAVTGMGKANTIISIPNIEGKPGETEVCIPLIAKLSYDGEPVSNLSYSAEIRFNANAFLPESPTVGKVEKVDGGYLESVLNISGGGVTLSDSETILEEICGVVLLTDDSGTEVRISKFSWNDPDICFDTIPGRLRSEEVCVRSLRSIRVFTPTNIQVIPNPAEDEIEVEVQVNAKGWHKLELIDVRGESYELYSWEVPENGSREYEFRINISNFSSGMYFIMLRTPMRSKVAPVFIVK